MAGKETADIVFCMDASGSMSPVFDAVREHVQDLVAALDSDLQRRWDLRFDFLSFQTLRSGPTYRSVFGDDPVRDLYKAPNPQKFFTADVETFKNALGRVTTGGDEAGPLALSACLDFPFRDPRSCHRVVILLTDEGTETGTHKEEYAAHRDELFKKIVDRYVLLYLVTPKSDGYEYLGQADRCEHTIVPGGNALATVPFTELMQSIGKSISVSRTSMQQAPEEKPLPLFGETSW